jgi:tetratricopeptide (TPR) repeat protein
MKEENKFQEALEILDGIISTYPDYSPAYEKKAWLLRDTPYGELDRAFEFAYKAYQRNPESINLMELVSNIARDVDFFPITYTLAERGIELYPNNNQGYRIKLRSLLYEGKFEEVDQILNQFIGLYGERVKGFFAIQMSYMAYERGEYEEGLDIINFGFEDFLEKPVQIETDVQEVRARFKVIFLEKLGRVEEAQEWTSKVKTYMEDKLNSMSEDETYNKLVVRADLAMTNKDFKTTAELYEKMHFEYNSKANWPVIFKTEIAYFPFKESEYYQPLREKIDVDLSVMRANVIDYLKAEGEWKEEYEVKEN